MVRSILLGLLVLSSASACKGSGADAPVVEPGATVGKVIEITGKVTATRGTATRDLDASSTVSGDDVITTTGDGRVTILLAHNNAKWALGPNKHEQVAQSMAWQLAKADAPATPVDETTTAAGRHAERTAATGEAAATAPRTAVAPQENMKSADSGDPATGAPSPGAATQGAAPSEPTAQPQSPPPPARPDRTPETTPVARTEPKTEPKTDPKPERKPERTPESMIRAKGSTPVKVAVGSRGDDPPSKGMAPSGGGDAASPKEGNASIVSDESDGGANPVKAALDRETADLHKCVVASGKDKLTIVVRVRKGTTMITLADGTAADRACLGKIAARIRLTVDTSYATTITK